jgi:hypothetical protein
MSMMVMAFGDFLSGKPSCRTGSTLRLHMKLFGRIIEDTPTPLYTQNLAPWSEEEKCLVIATTYLLPAITAWMAVEEYSKDERKYQRFNRICHLTHEVRQILRAIHHSAWLDDGDGFSGGFRVIMSICLLGEQIEAAAEAIYLNPEGLNLAEPWPMTEKLRKSYLQQTGICEKEAEWIVRTSGAEYSVYAYAYLTSQVVGSRGQGNCSDSECKAVSRHSGSPAHVTSNCLCNQLSLSDADQALLLKLIKEGSIAMLTVEHEIEANSNVKLALRKFDRSKESELCIALSHVWSDMLGNPDRNSMPACQLAKLQALTR